MIKKILFFIFTFLFLTFAYAQQSGSAEKVSTIGATATNATGPKYLAPGITFSAIAGINTIMGNAKYRLIVEDANFKYFDQTYPVVGAFGYRFGMGAAFESKSYAAEIPLLFNVDRFRIAPIDSKNKLAFRYIMIGINNRIKFAKEKSAFIIGIHKPITLANNVASPVFLNVGYGQRFLKNKLGVDLSFQINLDNETNNGSTEIRITKNIGQTGSSGTIRNRSYSYSLLTLNLHYNFYTTRKEKSKPDPQIKLLAKAEKVKAANDAKLAKQKLAQQKRDDKIAAKQKVIDEKQARQANAIQKREEQKVANQKSAELRMAEIKLEEQKREDKRIADQKAIDLKLAEIKLEEQKLALANEKKAVATDTIQMRGSGNPLKGLNIDKAIKEIKVGKYYALIIGIDNYTGTWAKLKNGVNDAKAIETLLKTKYKFEVFKTLYNAEATRAKIMENLDWLVNTVQPNDNVLIYYSGHGEFKKALNKGYWVPSDATSNTTSQFISNSDLQTYLGGIKSKHTLLLSDACFSGDIFRGNTVSIPFENSDKYYGKVYEKMSRQAISSGGIEPVMDGGKDGHSVFAYYVLKMLNNNTDKYYDASQLFENIKIPIVNNSDQTPDFSSIKNTDDEGGHFIFIKK